MRRNRKTSETLSPAHCLRSTALGLRFGRERFEGNMITDEVTVLIGTREAAQWQRVSREVYTDAVDTDRALAIELTNGRTLWLRGFRVPASNISTEFSI